MFASKTESNLISNTDSIIGHKFNFVGIFIVVNNNLFNNGKNTELFYVKEKIFILMYPRYIMNLCLVFKNTQVLLILQALRNSLFCFCWVFHIAT